MKDRITEKHHLLACLICLDSADSSVADGCVPVHHRHYGVCVTSAGAVHLCLNSGIGFRREAEGNPPQSNTGWFLGGSVPQTPSEPDYIMPIGLFPGHGD